MSIDKYYGMLLLNNIVLEEHSHMLNSVTCEHFKVSVESFQLLKGCRELYRQIYGIETSHHHINNVINHFSVGYYSGRRSASPY